ncbi:MAG: hypothetical protein WD825_05380 [Gemmatimonadaceae bacterium]
MTRRTVGRVSRAIDLVSLLLLLGGAVLFVAAYFGMQTVSKSPDTPFVPGTVEAYALTNEYLRLQRLSYFALGLIGLGIATGLSAAVHAHKIAKRQAAESSPED